MKDKQRKLTKKQKLFVAEYQKDWNATRAAIVVGYKEHRASEIACRLVKKSQVQEAIEKAMAERLRKIGVHSERILTEVARVGLSDLRKLYNEDGSLKLPHEWSDEAAAAVAGVEVSEIFAGEGKARTLVGHTKKVRVFDKVRALELLSKNLGIIGNGKHRDEDGDEGIERVLTTLELSAKIVYLVKLAVERKKEIEGKKETERPKNAG
jgi:phage terminase small subunit